MNVKIVVFVTKIRIVWTILGVTAVTVILDFDQVSQINLRNRPKTIGYQPSSNLNQTRKSTQSKSKYLSWKRMSRRK